MIAIFIMAAFTVAVFKYQRFGYNGFDLAIYNQTFWNTVHGRLFANSINPPSYLGDHAEWLILALAPFYALVPHPLTLVFLKILAIGLSAILVWKISRVIFAGQTQIKYLPLLFAGCWLMNPFVWFQTLFEFHLIAFAIPCIFGAIYFYLEKKYWPFLAAIGVLLLAREDMALVVVCFALLAVYEFLRGQKRNLLCWALVPAALAIIVFLLDQRIIAHFNPDGAYKYLVYYHWLGNTPLAIVKNIFWHPLATLTHFLKFGNLEVALAFILPLLFLPLFGGRYLLLATALSAEYLLTASGADSLVLKTQYSAPFLPIMIVAGISGYATVLKKKGPLAIIPPPLLPASLIIATVYCWFTLGPGLGLLSAFRPLDARTVALAAVVARIPANASVIASTDTLTELSSREHVWPMDYVWLGKKQFGVSAYALPTTPDYIVYDQNDFLYFEAAFPQVDWTLPLMPQAPDNLRALIVRGNYGPIYSSGGVALLKAGIGGGAPFFAIVQAPSIAHPDDAAMGSIDYLGYGSAGEQLMLYFRAAKTLTMRPVIRLNGTYVPLGNGTDPASEWKPNEIAAVTLPDPGGKLKLELDTIGGWLDMRGDASLFLKINKNMPLAAAKVIRP